MGSNKKILIVDDEKMNIMALAHFLKHYELIIAIDGASALEVAEKHKPDIILLDIIMPEMNGFEVLDKLKNSATTMNIPVIFISGLNNGEEEKGLLLGAVDFIAKPFNKSVVLAKIKIHLKMVEYSRTIEKMCMLDPLTELPNRQNFDARMDAEWERARREKKPLGLIILGIDNFKAYNDAYGHPHGDSLLQALAEVFGNIPDRTTDFTARWDGDTFAVLLPDTGADDTLRVAEQIRITVKDIIVPHVNGTGTSATVSLGAHSIIPGDNDSSADFIAEAGDLLNNAKQNGKDQTCGPASTADGMGECSPYSPFPSPEV